jgi:hypothetical protein
LSAGRGYAGFKEWICDLDEQFAEWLLHLDEVRDVGNVVIAIAGMSHRGAYQSHRTDSPR